MTIIVGIITAEDVIVGADSLGSNGNQKLRMKTPKVIRRFVHGKKRPILIGCSGSYRVLQLLQTMPMPDHDGNKSTDRYIIEDLVSSIRKHLDTNGALGKRENEDFSEIQLLLAYDHRLFEVQGDFSVTETDHDYIAVGSGLEYALGALWASRDVPPQDRIVLALQAAAEFNPFCGVPFDVLCLNNKQIKRIVT